MKPVNKKKWILLDIVLLFVLIAIDQITKLLAINYLKDANDFPIIKDVFELHFLPNSAAAFSLDPAVLFSNQIIFYIIIAIVVLIAISFIIYRLPAKKKYNILHILCVLIAAGAVGNIIDRFRFGYVVDFIYFKLINFPVFNVADCYITCAAIALILVLLFKYKDNDLKFLSLKSNKTRDVK